MDENELIEMRNVLYKIGPVQFIGLLTELMKEKALTIKNDHGEDSLAKEWTKGSNIVWNAQRQILKHTLLNHLYKMP